VWPMDTSRYICVEPSGEMQDRHGRLVYPVLNADEQWCFDRGLDTISPYLLRATLAVEDHRFDFHPGVDPIAVMRAVWQNAVQGRVVSGASTLAMQVVKLQAPYTRSFPGKLLQALEAVRLRLRVSKEEILWAYLNNAPYGANLVGCEAAARYYFGKPANELTLPEAALLAGVPKNPNRYMPTAYPVRAKKRRAVVLQRMYDVGSITQGELTRAIASDLGSRRHVFPKLSPHLAAHISSRLERGQKVKTTLDAALQHQMEDLLYDKISRMRGEIGNAAAIVVDVSSAHILARVGSADFWNEEQDGQVDVCVAERSPGSALKPLTYALAMEKQVLYASEILLDDVWDQGLYNPENFDTSFEGLITAAEALRTSRNVPAITVLDRVGLDAFYQFLTDVGLTTLHYPPAHYGLGITLGNCEVKLEELTAAYCMLASGGVYRPLHCLLDEPAPEPTRLLSRGTCLKIYEMLEQPLPDGWKNEGVNTVSIKPRVCWKTGTSQGYRDAWTFVFNQQYLVGVWLGNNSGESSPWLIGAQAALPVAAAIFERLEQKNTASWPRLDDDLKPVSICALSGLPATEWCVHTKEEYIPREQYVHRKCDMHYPSIYESVASKDARIIERWPATSKEWNLARIEVPFVRDPRGQQSARKTALRIVSPARDAEFILTGEKGGDRIQLQTSDDGHSPIHWYLDETYLGSSSLLQPLYIQLQPGRHHLSCMTTKGHIDRVSFTVLVPSRQL
jgi:penicillin-binding protein 1C